MLSLGTEKKIEKILLILDEGERSIDINRKILSKNNYKLSFKIEYLLLKIFEKEIQLSRNLLIKINELSKENDFNIHKIFHILKGKNNFITKESLKNFFDKSNGNTLISEINNILKRLDINKDGKVDLYEFHIFLGFPNCSKCCPLINCSICGCSFCDYCFTEVYCYIHNCIHKYSSQIPSSNKINNHKRQYYFNLTNLNNNYDIGEKFEHILNNINLDSNKESNFLKTFNKRNIDNNIISNSFNEEELSENKNMINVSPKQSSNSSNSSIIPKYIISKNDSFEFLSKKKKTFYLL